MKTNLPLTITKKARMIVVLVAFLACGIYSNAAFSQVDYFYGENPSGFRLGFGVGSNWLQDRYRVNPPKPTLNLDLQYNTSEYFSVGFQAQQGTLFGENGSSGQGQPFANVTNSYTSASFNIRLGLGLLSQGTSQNNFTEVVKRFYVGTGLGYINSKNSFADVDAPSFLTKHQSNGVYVPLNFGTTFDLRKLTHSDRFEFNPEYQFNIVNDKYLEGFTSTYTKSNYQYYSQITLSLRYKF